MTNEPFHYSLDINHAYPEPRMLKASWSVETDQDLRYMHAMKRKWQWYYLWNWKAAWQAYKSLRLERLLVKAMAEEIRKEVDKELIKALPKAYENYRAGRVGYK